MFRHRALWLLFLVLTLFAAAARAQICEKGTPGTGPEVPPPPPGPVDYAVGCEKPQTDIINSRCTFTPIFSDAMLPKVRQYSWHLDDPRNDSLPPIFYTPQSYSWTFQSPITYHTSMKVWLTTGEILIAQKDVNIAAVPAEAYFAYTTSFGLCVTFDTPIGNSASYRYHWTVGDMDLEDRWSQSASRVFDKAGIYNVTLELYRIDGVGGSSTYTLPVPVANFTPTAWFNATRDGNDTRLFSFDGTVSRDEPAPGPPRTQNCVGSLTNAAIASYDWDFGDGMVGHGATTTHRYAAGGQYNVTLRVTDRLGVVGVYSNPNVIVPNQAPSAFFNFDCTPGLTCSFDASTSMDDKGITSYTWTFPDGTLTTTSPKTTRTFAATGAYNVSLSVSDGSLSSPTITRNLRVTNEVAVASYYYALQQPCRAFDSRTTGQPLAGSEVRSVPIAGSVNCGVPANATAAAVTLSIINPQGDGFVALTPAGSSVQSYLHVAKARGSRVNDASVKLTGGAMLLRNAIGAPSVDFAVDVVGYYGPAAAASSSAYGPLTYTPLAQCRLFDSRVDASLAINGTASTRLRLRDNTACSVPAEADALSLNFTLPVATGTSYPPGFGGPVADGPVAIIPATASGTSAPRTWTMWAHAPQMPMRAGTILTLARTSGNDTAMEYYADYESSLQTIADLNGYFRTSALPGGLRYYPITPCRAFDGVRVTPNVPIAMQMQGNCGIPRGARAVMANVTAAGFTTGGSVLLAPNGDPFAYVTVTYQPGEFAVANGAILPLSDQINDLSAKSDGDPVVIVDVLGYFAQ